MDEGIVLETSDFGEDRYSRLRLIPWWDQSRLAKAVVLVVGAGAIGNEVVKNLALLGIGRIIVVDMDSIEHSNLARSVLFRAGDVGRGKADTACERAMEINPDVRAVPVNANVVTGVGLGLYRRVDAVIGALDNREARLAVNQACWKVGKPWIDGAIEALSGFARVFTPPDGPCYECTMTSEDWRQVNKRRSCALLTHEQMLEGKIPTTPTSSSVIAGIEVQELLKLLHADRGLPTLAGRGFVFNGLTHDSFVVEYQRREDCMAHDACEHIVETGWASDTATLAQMLERAVGELGNGACIEFDREIASRAACRCGAVKELFAPVNALKAKDIACPSCGEPMALESFHAARGGEEFLSRTAAQIGLPPLHVIGARKGAAQAWYELTGDLKGPAGRILGIGGQDSV